MPEVVRLGLIGEFVLEDSGDSARFFRCYCLPFGKCIGNDIACGIAGYYLPGILKSLGLAGIPDTIYLAHRLSFFLLIYSIVGAYRAYPFLRNTLSGKLLIPVEV